MESHIRDRIKAARLHAGYTQEKLGELIGVSKSAVSMWETANPKKYTRPTLENLAALSRLTGVSTDWLVGDMNSVADVKENSTTNGHTPLENDLSARGLEIGRLSDTLQPKEQDELLAYLKFASRLNRNG